MSRAPHKKSLFSTIQSRWSVASSFYILLILFFSFFATKALFHSGFYTSHDGWHQVARLYHFDAAIRNGQFPPKWGGGLLYGAGYPLFVFSYHMPWFIAEPFVFLGMSIYDALKITYTVGFVFSGICMFLWIRDMWEDHAAFIAATLYMWAPYRFSNIYVRGALGEATVLMFLPLIYWAIYRMGYKYKKVFLVVGSVGIFGAMLSHAMIIYLLAVPTIFYCGALLVSVTNKKKFLKNLLLLAMLGIGLSAYYLIPAIFYQNITVFAQIMGGYYNDHFVNLKRLIYSPWGFGFSAEGPGSMSLQFGIAQWLTLGFTVVLIITMVMKKKDAFKNILVPGSFLLGTCFCLYMILPISRPVWKVIEHIIIVDFPWRFLSVSVFLASVLGGWCIYIVPNRFAKYGLIAALCLIALYTNRNHIRVNQYVDTPESVFVESELTTNTHDEYLPVWGNKEYLTKAKRAMVMDEIGAEAKSYKILENTTKNKKLLVENEKTSKFSINLLYFPFWHAAIDGKDTMLSHDTNGLAQLKVPSGRHTITVYFQESVLSNIGIVVSVISMVLAILVALPGKIYVLPQIR